MTKQQHTVTTGSLTSARMLDNYLEEKVDRMRSCSLRRKKTLLVKVLFFSIVKIERSCEIKFILLDFFLCAVKNVKKHNH